jgi:hypothetical protein
MKNLNMDLQRFAWDDVDGIVKDKTDFTKFVNGATQIRIIDSEPFSRWSHWLQTAKRSITCPGQGCPVCELIKVAKDNKETPKYASSQKHSMNILNRNTGKLEVMEQGKQFFEQLRTLHKEVEDIRNYDIKVMKSGEGTNTTYTLIPLAPAPLSDADVALAQKKMDLKEYFKVPTNKQIIDLINGVDPKEVFKSEAIIDGDENVGL